MNDANLIAYLNDHLAGSVTAVELIEHWRAVEIDAALAAMLDELLADIRADQDVLRDVLAGVGGTENTLKKSAAWLTEKLGRLKTMAAGTTASAWAFYRLEQFDFLRMGVFGKQALWEALEAMCADEPRLTRFDWRALQRRAHDQIARIEAQRVRMARAAFADAV